MAHHWQPNGAVAEMRVFCAFATADPRNCEGSHHRLKKGLDPKLHPFLHVRDAAVCPAEILQHSVSIFGV